MRRGLGSELGHGSYGRVNLGTKGIPGRGDCKGALAIETLRDEKADVSKGHRADAEFAAALGFLNLPTTNIIPERSPPAKILVSNLQYF